MELQKKVNGRICVRDIRFSAADPPSYVTFYRFFLLLSSFQSDTLVEWPL